MALNQKTSKSAVSSEKKLKIGDAVKVGDTNCLITHVNPDKTYNILYVDKESRRAAYLEYVKI